MQDNFSILEYLGEPEVLTQLAEEASELAQAALKLRRAWKGTNPTPKTEEECRAALLEEAADVELCFEVLELNSPFMRSYIGRIMCEKKERWQKRLVNGCGERSEENG